MGRQILWQYKHPQWHYLHHINITPVGFPVQVIYLRRYQQPVLNNFSRYHRFQRCKMLTGVIPAHKKIYNTCIPLTAWWNIGRDKWHTTGSLINDQPGDYFFPSIIYWWSPTSSGLNFLLYEEVYEFFIRVSKIIFHHPTHKALYNLLPDTTGWYRYALPISLLLQ